MVKFMDDDNSNFLFLLKYMLVIWLEWLWNFWIRCLVIMLKIWSILLYVVIVIRLFLWWVVIFFIGDFIGNVDFNVRFLKFYIFSILL